MRYEILLALLLCLPVRVEAWQVVGGGSGGGTVTVLDDDLYEASPVSIASHTPSPGPGGAWTTVATDTNYIQVDTTRARPVMTASRVYAVSASSPFTLGEVVATGRASVAAISRNFSSCLFANQSFTTIGDVDGYCAHITGLGELTLYQMTDGVGSVVATGNTCTGFSISSLYDLILTASSDNNYSAKLMSGESEICSTTPTQDTTYQGAKYPGLAIQHDLAWITYVKGVSSD